MSQYFSVKNGHSTVWTREIFKVKRLLRLLAMRSFHCRSLDTTSSYPLSDIKGTTPALVFNTNEIIVHVFIISLILAVLLVLLLVQNTTKPYKYHLCSFGFSEPDYSEALQGLVLASYTQDYCIVFYFLFSDFTHVLRKVFQPLFLWARDDSAARAVYPAISLRPSTIW